jgi:hypothetical protein
MPRGLAAPEMTATLLASNITLPPAYFLADFCGRVRLVDKREICTGR